MSGNARNQIVVACVRHIQAMHMTPDEANQVSRYMSRYQMKYLQFDYHLNKQVITTVTSQYPSNGNDDVVFSVVGVGWF